MAEPDPFENIDYNNTGQTQEELEAKFEGHPWKVAVVTLHGTPAGQMVFESYASTFPHAMRCSDVVLKAIFGGPGINSG